MLRLFVVKKVLEVDGIIRQAVGFRVEVEAYLWCDPPSGHYLMRSF